MPKQPATLPITALVPTFNRARLLAEALASLLVEPAPAQIIVIDDGSDDDTAKVVASYGGRIEYLRQENAGKSAALNHGLRHATQPYIWIFDDDDIAEPGAITLLYQALESRPEAGYAYGACTRFQNVWPAADVEDGWAVLSDDSQALFLRMMEDFFIWQGAMLVRRSVLDEVGPFNANLARCQDYDMALRILRRTRGVGLPIVVFHQRHHAGVRGPRSAAIPSTQVDEAWRRFVQVIHGGIYHQCDLAEFCLGAAGALTPRQRLTALIQRGCLMGRCGLWYLAIEDMRVAAEEACDILPESLNTQEINALRRVFERGGRSWFDEPSEARLFAQVLRRFPPGLGAEIAGNLLLPVTNSIKRALQGGSAREWIHLMRILRAFGTPAAFRAYRRARRAPVIMPGLTIKVADRLSPGAATILVPAC